MHDFEFSLDDLVADLLRLHVLTSQWSLHFLFVLQPPLIELCQVTQPLFLLLLVCSQDCLLPLFKVFQDLLLSLLLSEVRALKFLLVFLQLDSFVLLSQDPLLLLVDLPLNRKLPLLRDIPAKYVSPRV